MAEDDNVINNSNTKEETFQNDTLESLKNEIEVKEKKDNKILFLAAIAAVVIIIIFLNS